jgi:5-methyltetrahydrofolate--homocysteine methyltransferase
LREYEELWQSIKEGNAENVIILTQQAVNLGYPPHKILENGLMYGMNTIAEKFKHERVLIPEVLLSSRAMHAGLSTLDPYLNKEGLSKKAKVVLGTVEGDLHDIGKNLIRVLWQSIGLNVVDLGINVSAKTFIAAIRKEKPDILAMSALLTTTLPKMKEVINELKTRELRSKVKVVLGGGPVTEEFCREIGADYYFSDAFAARNYLKDNMHKIIDKRS